MEEKYILRFDGGSNPNPGKCAGAYVIYDKQMTILAEGGRYMLYGTNNIGEYTGLLIGLERCISMGIKHIDVEGDSLLVVSQVSGKWKIKNDNLREIYQKIMECVKKFDHFSIQHIRREYNQHADLLSDTTLDLRDSWELSF